MIALKGRVDASLEKSFNSVKAQMRSLASSKYINDFGAKWEARAKSLSSIGDTLQNVGKSYTAKFTVPIVTGMAAAGKAAGQYQYELSKVSSIIKANGDTSAGSMDKFSKSIMNAATQSGIAADEYTEMVYQAISANVSAKNSISAVNAAHKLSVAGYTTNANALDVLTTVTNAYGKSAGSMTHISDVLIQTQNRGKTTVDDLAASMGKVIPTAQAYGVSLEQLGASYSVLTQRGIKTKVATTYLSSMYTELGKSGTKVAQALKQETGKSFQELMKSGKSVADVMQILQDHAKKTGTSFNDMWGNVNAAKGAQTVLDSRGKFNQYWKEMQTSAGVTKKAFADVAATLPAQMNKLKGSLKNALIGLGSIAVTTLLPIVQSITPIIQRVATAFANMSPGMQKMIGQALLAVAAFGPLTSVIGKVASIGGKLSGVISILGGTFKGLGGIIGAVTSGGLGSLGGLLGATGAAAVPFAGKIMLAVAAIAAITAATVGAVKGIKKLHKHMKEKSTAKNKVQGSYDTYQRTKIAYDKGQASADDVKQAKIAYEKTQDAYQKQYNKPVKVKVKTEEDFKKADNKAAEKKEKQQTKASIDRQKSALKSAKKTYRDTVKATENYAKRKADLAAEEAREQGKSLAEQNKIHRQVYQSELKNNKALLKAKKDLKAQKDALDKVKGKKPKAEKPKAEKPEKLKAPDTSAWAKFKQKMSGYGQSIAKTMSGHWDSLKKTTSTKWGAIKGNTSSSFEKIRSTMSSKMSQAHSFVSGKLSAIRQAFSTKLSNAFVGVRNSMSKVKTTFHNALNGIHTWVKNKLQQIRNVFAHPITATVNVVKKITGGGGGKKPSKHAKGGFTSGLAIAGEDPRYPVEAVISFNPAYRQRNIEYWQRAGRMLGIYQQPDIQQASEASAESYNRLGDMTNDDFSRLGQTSGVASVARLSDSYGNVYNQLGDMENDPFSRYGESGLGVTKLVYNSPQLASMPVTSHVIGMAAHMGDLKVLTNTEHPTYTAEIGDHLSYDDRYLGMAAAPQNVSSQQSSTVKLDGLNFSPVINVPAGTDITAEKIVDMLRSYAPEFTDFVVSEIEKREGTNYVNSYTY